MPRRRRRPSPAPSGPGTDDQGRAILAALDRLRSSTAREVMTPRVDVVALAAPVRTVHVAAAVKRSGHSRFPVYEEDLDHLVGVLFVKDLFRHDGPPRLRKPFVVPETRSALDLLQEMRRRRRAFAVVVDEHGGVEGVLTVKDLVGQLVGGLADEYDQVEEEELTRVDASRWLIDGACPVERARQELGLHIPDGEFVTVAGFLLDRFGRIPAEGDEVEHEGWRFRVEEMERRRIAKVVAREPSGTIDAHGK